MAASFKLTCLVKKLKPPVNFPRFEWRDIDIKEQLGSGTKRRPKIKTDCYFTILYDTDNNDAKLDYESYL